MAGHCRHYRPISEPNAFPTHPQGEQALEDKRGVSPAPKDVQFTIEVSLPFGADLLATIASAQPALALHEAINRLNQTKDCASLADALETSARYANLRGQRKHDIAEENDFVELSDLER